MEIQDDSATEGAKLKPVLSAYVSAVPRTLGFHFMNTHGQNAKQVAPLGIAGMMLHGDLCDCQAPAVPFHFKPISLCWYLNVFGILITLRMPEFIAKILAPKA